MKQRLIASLILFCSLCLPLFAALPYTSVWEVRYAGSDTNGGGFDSAGTGTDMSQFNNANSSGCSSCQSSTANLSTTDAVAAGTTTITSATAAFTSAITGNIIYLAGGSGTLAAGWYRATYVSTTSITVDRTVATGTGITMNIGGAMLSPGKVCGVPAVSGNIVYVGYDGTSGHVFSITSATANASQGTINCGNVIFQGYAIGSSRTLNNTDSPPTIQLNVATATMFGTGFGSSIANNFVLDGNSQTTSKANGKGSFINVTIKNFTSNSSNNILCVYCTLTANSAIVASGSCIFCESYANTGNAIGVDITSNGAGVCVFCLSYSNTGSTTFGIELVGNGDACIFCSAYSNAKAGITGLANTEIILDSYAEANGTYGVDPNGNQNYAVLTTANYNNTSGAVNSSGVTAMISGAITPSSSAFVSPSGFNFALNNTSGAGALLRNSAFPGVFPRGDTNTYLDVGAARHQDPSSSSTTSAAVY